MPIADTKKVQTMINVAADQIEIIQSAIATMKTIRTAFNTQNPDVTGTALEGNKVALSNSIDALDTEANLAIWTTITTSQVPSHQGKALD
jgi:hypothetical protein